MLEYLQCQSYFKLVKFVERLVEIKFPPLNAALLKAEKRSKVKKNLMVHAFVSLVLFVSAITYFGPVLRYISGFFYPAFYTMEAMNTKNQEQMHRWLKYWAVYGFLQVIEGVIDHSLGFLPMFHILKALFVMWCHAPIESNGANFIFERYMVPAWEMMKNNSLDTIGSRALDELGNTLKIKMSDTNVPEKVEELKKDVANAVAGLSVGGGESASSVAKGLETVASKKAGDMVSSTIKNGATLASSALSDASSVSSSPASSPVSASVK